MCQYYSMHYDYNTFIQHSKIPSQNWNTKHLQTQKYPTSGSPVHLNTISYLYIFVHLTLHLPSSVNLFPPLKMSQTTSSSCNHLVQKERSYKSILGKQNCFSLVIKIQLLFCKCSFVLLQFGGGFFVVDFFGFETHTHRCLF